MAAHESNCKITAVLQISSIFSPAVRISDVTCVQQSLSHLYSSSCGKHTTVVQPLCKLWVSNRTASADPLSCAEHIRSVSHTLRGRNCNDNNACAAAHICACMTATVPSKQSVPCCRIVRSLHCLLQGSVAFGPDVP